MDDELRAAERACFEDPHGEKILRYFRCAHRAGCLREAREKLTERIVATEGEDRFVVKIGLILAADEAIGEGPEEMQKRDYERNLKAGIKP